MYIPPFTAMLANLNVTKEEFDTSAYISVPTSLLKMLISLAQIHGDFNEATYLSANPDVAAATKEGTVSNPRLHYIGNGYFEGREGGVPDVDEKWYTSRYQDVADGIRRRTVKSARQHFWGVGAGELRAPAEAYVLDAVQWGKAFGKG